jgi:hypothetical protein
MNVSLNRVPRAEKRDIAQKVVKNLKARAKKGPKEPALDEYTDELDEIAAALDTHVAGTVEADAARAARLARLDRADDDVDTWYRHVEGFVSIEARRRTGPNVALAEALHRTAFPDGLAHVDDPVADENRLCRDSLSVLRSPEHAATLKAIELPLGWLDKWEKALDESDAALAEVESARKTKKTHVSGGRNAEADWVETMVRLRKYVASRARKDDAARIAEGKELLAPLADAMSRLRTTAAARATRRSRAEDAEAEESGSTAPTPAAARAAPAADAKLPG